MNAATLCAIGNRAIAQSYQATRPWGQKIPIIHAIRTAMSACSGTVDITRLRLTTAALLLTIIVSIDAYGDTPVTSLIELRQHQVEIQQWDLSCGAAALTTLLKYQHGIDIDEKQVARELLSRHEYLDNPELLSARQGFSLLDLKRFVERRNLDGNGFGGLNLDHLIDLAPAIVPVNFNGYRHFVVFRGVAANRVLLADPAWGNRTLSRYQFDKAWFSVGKLGKVAFAVKSPDRRTGIGLRPQARDFAILQ